jgi:hypothetical protein
MNYDYQLRDRNKVDSLNNLVKARFDRKTKPQEPADYGLSCDYSFDQGKALTLGAWILPLCLIGLLFWVAIISQFLSWFWLR